MTSFSLTEDAKTRTLAIFYDNGDTETLPETHPSFKALIDLFLSGKADDTRVAELANVLKALANKMSQVSDRVTIQGKKIFFDGDPLRGELGETIRGLYEDGNEVEAGPLVKFLEKASTNPQLESIDQLYAWVKASRLTLTESGDFIAYKGVYQNRNKEHSPLADDNTGYSGYSGEAQVNGVEHKGYIPYPLKAVVTMPRSVVDARGEVACSTGLHAGTFSYAQAYARFKMLAVQINPRDVVSVPKDGYGEKLRVRRMVVLDEITQPIKEAVFKTEIPDGYTGPAEVEVAPVVEVKPAPDVVGAFGNVRDSKGRFTKEAAQAAKRDSKGRFIKGGI